MNKTIILLGLLFFGLTASAVPKVTANIACTADSAYEMYNGQEVNIESNSEGTIVEVSSLGLSLKVSQLLAGKEGGVDNFTLNIFNEDNAFILIEELPSSILELVKSLEEINVGDSTQEVSEAEDFLSGVLIFEDANSGSQVSLLLTGCRATKVSLLK